MVNSDAIKAFRDASKASDVRMEAMPCCCSGTSYVSVSLPRSHLSTVSKETFLFGRVFVLEAMGSHL